MWEDVSVCLFSFIIGIVSAVAAYAIQTKGEKKAVKATKSEKVDLEKIRGYMLPNNQGVPIDQVVERLKKTQSELPFTIDFAKSRGASEP